MQNEILILVDLENVSFNYVIEQIEVIKKMGGSDKYLAYAFCDFTIKNSNILADDFYKFNIKPVQVFHQQNKKNNVDFVLLRYAYSQIFQNKNLKHIYLFSGDGDFIDLCIYIKKQNIKLTICSSGMISSSLQNLSIKTSKEITLDISNSKKSEIVRQEFAKIYKNGFNKNLFLNNIKKRIPNSAMKKLSEIFPYIENCSCVDDLLRYHHLTFSDTRKEIIKQVYDINKGFKKDIIWIEIQKAFKNKYKKISEIFPEENIKTVKKLIEYCFK